MKYKTIVYELPDYTPKYVYTSFELKDMEDLHRQWNSLGGFYFNLPNYSLGHIFFKISDPAVRQILYSKPHTKEEEMLMYDEAYFEITNKKTNKVELKFLIKAR